jgi:hypothetical protein
VKCCAQIISNIVLIFILFQMFSCPAAIRPWLKRERVRYQSFFTNNRRPWSYRGGQPMLLAKAGFYYYGDQDYVQCAFCGVVVGHWHSDENPMEVHKHCYPTCSFMNGHEVGNIPFDHIDQCEVLPGDGIDVCGIY